MHHGGFDAGFKLPDLPMEGVGRGGLLRLRLGLQRSEMQAAEPRSHPLTLVLLLVVFLWWARRFGVGGVGAQVEWRLALL
jgi:hypothetical protein